MSSLLSRGRLNTTTAVGPTPVVGFWGGGSQLVWEGSPHPQLDPQLIWQVVASWTHRNTLCHQLSLSNFTGGGVTQSLSVNNQLETGDKWCNQRMHFSEYLKDQNTVLYNILKAYFSTEL